MKPCSSTQETIQTRRKRGNFGLVLAAAALAAILINRRLPV
jgi:hypothetical protein